MLFNSAFSGGSPKKPAAPEKRQQIKHKNKRQNEKKLNSQYEKEKKRH